MSISLILKTLEYSVYILFAGIVKPLLILNVIGFLYFDTFFVVFNFRFLFSFLSHSCTKKNEKNNNTKMGSLAKTLLSKRS